jgi:hypothetical protein
MPIGRSIGEQQVSRLSPVAVSPGEEAESKLLPGGPDVAHRITRDAPLSVRHLILELADRPDLLPGGIFAGAGDQEIVQADETVFVDLQLAEEGKDTSV